MRSSAIVDRPKEKEFIMMRLSSSIQDVLVQLSLWLQLIKILIYCHTINSCRLCGAHSMYFNNMSKSK